MTHFGNMCHIHLRICILVLDKFSFWNVSFEDLSGDEMETWGFHLAENPRKEICKVQKGYWSHRNVFLDAGEMAQCFKITCCSCRVSRFDPVLNSSEHITKSAHRWLKTPSGHCHHQKRSLIHFEYTLE